MSEPHRRLLTVEVAAAEAAATRPTFVLPGGCGLLEGAYPLPAPLIGAGSRTPLIPCFPDAAEAPLCVNVALTAGVPAVSLC